MSRKPSLGLEIGVDRATLPRANALEEAPLVLNQCGNSGLGQARNAAIALAERNELAAVIHAGNVAEIYPHSQRISIRKTSSAPIRHIIRMDQYKILLGIIATRRAELGLSERALCIRAGLKVDAVRTIRRNNAPKPDALAKLATALGLPPSVLLEAAANVQVTGSHDDVTLPEASDLDAHFHDLMSRMSNAEKVKAIEIMEILLRSGSEQD